MKRLTSEIKTLDRNISAIACAIELSANLREQFDLTCIARDAGTLDGRLDRALGDFLAAAHHKRRTRDDLGRAARRVCVFVADRARTDPAIGDRAMRLRRRLRAEPTADAFHGLAPELLEITGGMDGARAATHTLRLAKTLRAHLDAESRATAAREAYTHLLETAASLAVTLRALNRSLQARLDGAAAGARAVRNAA